MKSTPVCAIPRTLSILTPPEASSRALPALNAIRAHYPRAHITWLVETAAAGLVVGHRALDRVIVSHRKRWIRELKGPHWRKALSEIRDFWRELRDTDYDIIIDFQSLLKSALLVRLARGKRKIGFDKGMQHQEHSYLLLNERIPPVDMEVHALTRGLMLLNAIGIDTSRNMLALARARLNGPRFRHCQVRLGDMYNMPYESNSFDLALMHLTLHFAEQPAGVIREAARILRPGGRLLIVDFEAHKIEKLRSEHQHRWLGFNDTDVASWCLSAGLEPQATEVSHACPT